VWRLWRLLQGILRDLVSPLEYRRFRTIDRAPPIVTDAIVEEYWIGKNTDYNSLWAAYDSGSGYMAKYYGMTAHLIIIELEHPPREKPLFQHEAIFKTMKGYFHDLKRACLSFEEYVNAAPLYFYSVERGSSKYKFLGELRQLITFGSTLADEKALGRHLDNLDRRLAFLKKHFGPIVDENAFRAFMKARTTSELDDAVQRLFRCGIKSVKISKEPFEGDIERTEQTLIELKQKDDDGRSA
jgi:hypothetical protein